MKRIVFLLLAVALMAVPSVQASDVGFNLDLHIGSHPDPPFVVHERPMFLAPAELGFHVAVGVPYDMFFVSGSYYVCRDNHWYRGPSYNGPWQGVGPKHLPPGLAKKRYHEIIRVRDAEYARYKKDKRHYKGKPYYPEENYGHGRGYDDHGHGNGKKNKH
jgi:hypothetical protein